MRAFDVNSKQQKKVHARRQPIYAIILAQSVKPESGDFVLYSEFHKKPVERHEQRNTSCLFSSVKSLDRRGRREDMMDDSAEIAFRSFVIETTVSSFGTGRDVHSLSTPSSVSSADHGAAFPPRCPEGWLGLGKAVVAYYITLTRWSFLGSQHCQRLSGLPAQRRRRLCCFSRDEGSESVKSGQIALGM